MAAAVRVTRSTLKDFDIPKELLNSDGDDDIITMTAGEIDENINEAAGLFIEWKEKKNDEIQKKILEIIIKIFKTMSKGKTATEEKKAEFTKILIDIATKADDMNPKINKLTKKRRKQTPTGTDMTSDERTKIIMSGLDGGIPQDLPVKRTMPATLIKKFKGVLEQRKEILKQQRIEPIIKEILDMMFKLKITDEEESAAESSAAAAAASASATSSSRKRRKHSTKKQKTKKMRHK